HGNFLMISVLLLCIFNTSYAALLWLFLSYILRLPPWTASSMASAMAKFGTIGIRRRLSTPHQVQIRRLMPLLATSPCTYVAGVCCLCKNLLSRLVTPEEHLGLSSRR